MPLARAALLAGNAALALAILLTARLDLPDATLAYGALAVATASAWRLLRRRRLTTLLLASSGAWTLVTGILLVYLAPTLPQGGGALRWWHAVTGIAMLLAFLAHWARNSRRLVELAAKLRARHAVALAVAWLALALVALASLRPPLRALFDDRAFALLTTVSLVLAGAGVLYGAALATTPRVRAALARTSERNRLRGALDVSLLGTMWLATLTALPLQYLGRALRAADAYWLLAGWHVVVSALLLALVLFHAGFNARALASHAR